MSYGAKQQDSSQQMQMSIFDAAPTEVSAAAHPTPPDCEPWSSFEQLKREKEIAGFYISGHPLDHFKPILKDLCNTPISAISKPEEYRRHQGKKLNFAGIVTEAQHRIGKNGNGYGRITLEDYDGSMEWMLFGEDYSRYKHLFEKGQFLFVSARVAERGFERDETKKIFNLKPINIIYLRDAYVKLCTGIRLKFDVRDLSANTANIIQDWINASNEKCKKEGKGGGNKSVVFSIRAANNEFTSELYDYNVKVDAETFIALKPDIVPCEMELMG